MTVKDLDDIPTCSSHFGVHVLGVSDVCGTVTGDGIIVINYAQIVELPVPSEGNSFKTDTFLKTCITCEVGQFSAFEGD